MLMLPFGYSDGTISLRETKGVYMTLIVQPVDRTGLNCFSESRTLTVHDVQRVAGVEGIRSVNLRTGGRTARHYCLELRIVEALVDPKFVYELNDLVLIVARSMGFMMFRRVLGPERPIAARLAPAFREPVSDEDWLTLRDEVA